MPFEELLKVEQPKYLEIKDLELLRTSLLEDADYLYERYADKKFTWQEYLDLVHQLHQNLVEKFIADKEKLAHIFQTEQGSYYFVLRSGHSWRIKSEERGLTSQPIIDNIFFIDKKTAREILDDHSRGDAQNLIDREIKCVDYQKGACPFEIGIHNYNRPAIEKAGRYIRILGTMPPDRDKLEKQISCGTHIGHEITEIIK